MMSASAIDVTNQTGFRNRHRLRILDARCMIRRDCEVKVEK
jgi:hypothetical protein